MSRIRFALDFVSDCVLMGFAAWTLVAYLGMLTQTRVEVLVALWLILFALAEALMLRFAAGSAARPRRSERPANVWSVLLVVGLASGFLSALLGVWPHGVPWGLVWGLAAIAVGAALGAPKFRLTRGVPARSGSGAVEDATAALVGVAFAVISLFVFDPNADDVFYVNRATAVAELGHIPARDVIFTDEAVKRLGGTGLPVESFSALQGAIGHVLGIQGASVAYLLFPPVFTFLAVWALWRLLRSWAPRWPLACFALGCLFWLWSAGSDLSPGNFFVSRIWQGKVVFVAWLVPTLYAHLTRWVEDRDRLAAVLLLAGSVSSLGLTSSAAFVVPLIALVAALPLVAHRQWAGLGFLAVFSAFPLVVVLALTREYPLGDLYPAGSFPTDWYYRAMFGAAVVGAVSALGLWAAPWLARAGAPAALATGIASVAAVLLAPHVLALVHDLGGLPGRRSLRRTLWVIPFVPLVGLLAATSVSSILQEAGRRRPQLLGRFDVAVPLVLLGMLLVVFGRPVWTGPGGASKWELPRWKTPPAPLAEARSILARYEGKGSILARQPVMRAIALVTADPKAVNPRTWYATSTDEPSEVTAGRLLLTRLAMKNTPAVSPLALKRALAEVDVGLVCIGARERTSIALVEAAGPYRESFRAAGDVCLARMGERI